MYDIDCMTISEHALKTPKGLLDVIKFVFTTNVNTVSLVLMILTALVAPYLVSVVKVLLELLRR